MILKLRNIYEKNKKKDINIIPNTKENYITFSVKVVVDLYKPWNGTHQKNSINGTLEYKCTPITAPIIVVANTLIADLFCSLLQSAHKKLVC
jgi:hypothetical protein